ncbi:MAG: phage holin family protein [Christensenellales bacterium]
MDFINYIRPELLLVAVVLYFIGFGLKKIKRLKDNFIPLILGACGVIVCFVYLGIVEGFGWQSLVSGIVQGVLCAAASTYVNQVIKQMRKLGADETVTDIAEKLVEKTQSEDKNKK